MLELDPGVIGWAWVTFGVLLFLLYKLAWKPILSTIDKREKTIQDSLDNAEKAHKDAQSLLEKHEQMIKKAEEEAQKLIKENREAAEKSRQEIVQQASVWRDSYDRDELRRNADDGLERPWRSSW